MPVSDSEDGMMLTEVLVALAILSLLSISMFRVFAQTSSAVSRVEEARRRLEIAQNLLVTARSQPLAGASMLGESEGVRWRMDFRPVEASAAAKAISVRILVGDLQAPPVLTSVIVEGAP